MLLQVLLDRLQPDWDMPEAPALLGMSGSSARGQALQEQPGSREEAWKLHMASLQAVRLCQVLRAARVL